jgi:hypothetical protein
MAKGDAVSGGLDAVRDAKTILLTTYKRDGTLVETPVSIAFGGGRGTSDPMTRRGRPSACVVTPASGSRPRPCAAGGPDR